jgi:choline dehydrogenase-like flavoprotein
VVAARLADVDRTTTILLIERGPDNYDDADVIHPALYRANFDPIKGKALFYITGVEEQLANRPIVVAAGGLLGGGSSVNGMIYGRGQRVDYDSWATPGWSTDDLIPYLRKVVLQQISRSAQADI